MKNYTKKVKRITAIIKPTSMCNFSCDYCYVGSSVKQTTMSQKSLSKIMKQLALNFNKIHIIWHGGEPLLMGKSFYSKALYYQKLANQKHGSNFSNSMQSNASLVTRKFANFCKSNHIFVGSSLDGPKRLNNNTRKYKNGRGTYSSIIKGLKFLRKAQIGGSVILILNKKNIEHIEKIYRFLKKKKISVKLNPIIKAGSGINNYDDLGITPKEYGKALIQFFDLSFYDQVWGSISPLDTIISNFVLNENNSDCIFQKNCQNSMIGIGPNGDVYPCSRFNDIYEFKFGNIHENTLESILKSPVRKHLLERASSNIEHCRCCKYVKFCNSGCIHNAFTFKGDIMEPDYYCKAYKMIFNHIQLAVKKEMERINNA